MKNRKHSKIIISLFLCLAIFSTVTTIVSAAYFNTYKQLHPKLPNENGCNITEGFAIGSTYSYSAKIDSSKNPTKQVIIRTNNNTGKNALMTNSNNKTYSTELGHANDMDTCTIDGKFHLFVTTLKEGHDSLVKLGYSGTNYTKLAEYRLQYNGGDISVAGVKKYAKNENNVYFLFSKTKGNITTIYKGDIANNQPSGIINIKRVCTLNIEDSLVNGKKVTGLKEFTRQGIGYIKSKDQLLFPLTNKNVSIILVFDNISKASGTITANPDLSFRITSSAYPYLFEIEGCDEMNGKLYFNSNRKKNEDDIDHDAVCYFKNFKP